MGAGAVNISPRLLWTAFLAIVCIIAALAVIGFVQDPFGFKARKIERLEREAQTAQSEADARTLESKGRAEQIDRTETYHREVITIQSATAPFAAEARSATDADTPLDPPRTLVVGNADRSLCINAPRLAGCAPTGDPDR
jgi:type II secretory pathway pseudopilin PulG